MVQVAVDVDTVVTVVSVVTELAVETVVVTVDAMVMVNVKKDGERGLPYSVERLDSTATSFSSVVSQRMAGENKATMRQIKAAAADDDDWNFIFFFFLGFFSSLLWYNCKMQEHRLMCFSFDRRPAFIYFAVCHSDWYEEEEEEAEAANFHWP